MNSISDMIIQGRKAKRINQKDFAQLIGVSQPSLIKFEKGETDLIPLGVARRISRELDIPFNELFEIEYDLSKLKKYSERIDTLEKEVKEYKKEAREKDLLAKLFKDKYKELYSKKVEFDLTDVVGLLNDMYDAIMKIKDPEEQKNRLEQHEIDYRAYVKDIVQNVINEHIFSNFEIMELLYEHDINVSAILESSDTTQDNLVDKLTDYIRNFMDVSRFDVERFLFWYNQKNRKTYQST